MNKVFVNAPIHNVNVNLNPLITLTDFIGNQQKKRQSVCGLIQMGPKSGPNEVKL